MNIQNIQESTICKNISEIFKLSERRSLPLWQPVSLWRGEKTRSFYGKHQISNDFLNIKAKHETMNDFFFSFIHVLNNNSITWPKIKTGNSSSWKKLNAYIEGLSQCPEPVQFKISIFKISKLILVKVSNISNCQTTYVELRTSWKY